MYVASDYDGMRAYLGHIRQYPLLDAEEESRLARGWRQYADRRAFDLLVNSNLRFVLHIANRYRHSGFPLMDLIQEGNTGLIRAVQKFEPERHIRLVSYASWWIRAYIHAYILRSWSLVKLGTTDAQRKLFFSLRKAMREVDGEDDPEAAGSRRALLAARCGVREQDVAEMAQRLAGRDVSIHRPPGDDDAAALEDVVADGNLSPEDTVAGEELSALLGERLVDVLQGLSERERFVVERRVLADEPLRLREIGEAFGVTRERARQIEHEAREKLLRGFQDLRQPLSP